MPGLFIGGGVKRVMDSLQRYARATTDVYMRTRNFPRVQQTQWAQLGLRIAPVDGSQTGTVDVLIDPPPSMLTMSWHSIGMSGGKLRSGARQFMVGASWVEDQRALLQVPDLINVFNGQQAVGLVNENMLYSIEDIQHEAVGNDIVSWLLTCNANELR